MALYLIRHAQSDGNADPAQTGLVGNANLEITRHGWQQTQALGEFLWPQFVQDGMTEAPRLWVSPMERTLQTLTGVIDMMPPNQFKQELRLFVDDNLVEQDFGLLPYLLTAQDHPALKGYSKEDITKAAGLIMEFSKQIYGHQKFLARPPMGESPQDVCNRVSDFIATLRRDVEAGVTDHIIFTHGAVIKGFIKELYHLPMQSWDQISTPGNTDVIRIGLTPDRRIGEIRKIYDGTFMTPVNVDPLKGLKPFSIRDLPPVPAFLKASPNGS